MASAAKTRASPRLVAAQPGDKVAVTGSLGNAAAGLEMLTNDLQFDPEVTTYLRDAFLSPRPRIAEGQLLVKKGVTTAIDISDGFLADLRHICQMSSVSARVNVDWLPIFPPIKQVYGDKTLEMALSGGEDYELLFTGTSDIIANIKTELSCPVTIVGEITDGNSGEIGLFDSNGNPVQIHQSGWEHFK